MASIAVYMDGGETLIFSNVQGIKQTNESGPKRISFWSEETWYSFVIMKIVGWAYQPDKEEEDGDDTGVPGTADEYRGEVESGDYAACPCRSYNRADRAGYVPEACDQEST